MSASAPTLIYEAVYGSHAYGRPDREELLAVQQLLTEELGWKGGPSRVVVWGPRPDDIHSYFAFAVAGVLFIAAAWPVWLTRRRSGGTAAADDQRILVLSRQFAAHSL